MFGIIVGAIVGNWYNKRVSAKGDRAERLGVLVASGLIVGESLFGLGTTALVGVFGENPLAVVGDDFAGPAQFVGLAVLAAVVWYGYRWTRVEAAKVA